MLPAWPCGGCSLFRTYAEELLPVCSPPCAAAVCLTEINVMAAAMISACQLVVASAAAAAAAAAAATERLVCWELGCWDSEVGSSLSAAQHRFVFDVPALKHRFGGIKGSTIPLRFRSQHQHQRCFEEIVAITWYIS